MQTYVDANSPRHCLPFCQLPRGYVRFPAHIVEGVANLARKHGYGEDYARQSLVRNTLAWFYEGLPVAYRELPDGIEVLASASRKWARTAGNRKPTSESCNPHDPSSKALA